MSAVWSVPSLQTTDPKAKVASWVGLGNGGGGPRGDCCIWQAGVQDFNVNGDPSQFWYEDFGCTVPLCPSDASGNATENEIVVSNLSVSAGDSVYVAVDNGYPNRPVTYFMQNYRTGQGTSTVSVQNVDNTDTGLQAEFIVEENGPCSPGNCPYVPDVYGPFTDPAFVGAQATAGSDVRNLMGWNYTRIDLCAGNVGNIIAVPSDVGANNGFHIANYGQVYPTYCTR